MSLGLAVSRRLRAGRGRTPRLWLCTCSPPRIGAVASPMGWPSLNTQSPGSRSCSAILCPAGTAASTFTDRPPASTSSPARSSSIATPTLSRPSSRTKTLGESTVGARRPDPAAVPLSSQIALHTGANRTPVPWHDMRATSDSFHPGNEDERPGFSRRTRTPSRQATGRRHASRLRRPRSGSRPRSPVGRRPAR